ncbi:DUF835 domain-containing protein [Candidatus Methanomassiliicoccus intestinalis]|jgi:hypothetical protein|uniref:DUF835 domain-containing protein n=2 Tax=Candidatus Methanomassiliicoccus intestinalis TaxID=1406512 RepID=R9TBB7_METII|nr:DUF835 domain-containing protein [Candidatus Methanomassiliicoccus intestinalis]AGN26718.1 hypothetical protein MMINT_13980 [Candidatus Methanomassiliicoccus intestinalis Issoire-Mx1]TQS82847.1 MAG: hypothetical protein A3207_02550 [Candidatus Methanomassiliicoccus intestinalis]
MIITCDRQVYLFEEEKAYNTNHLIRNELKNGRRILYISKMPIGVLKEQFDKDNNLIDLRSLSPRPESNCISPMNVDALMHTIQKFIEDGSDGIIVINGIEIMEKWMSFSKIKSTIEYVKKLALENGYSVIITQNPLVINSHRLLMLEDIADEVISKKSKD